MSDSPAIVFEQVDGFAVCRLTGVFGLRDGVNLIRDVVARAREQGLSKLMIVITQTSGYPIPSLSMRLAMMREWSEAAAGYVRTVMICRPELIDPNKFGITMAANFGMTAEVFVSEAEGLAWLRELEG